MTKTTLKMERSPFYVERDEKTNVKTRKNVRTDVSPEVYQDIETYIKQRGDDFNMSRFVKELVMDFLNSNTIEQKFFRNLNAILLLPKTQDPDELQEKCKIVGFIDGNDWLEITLLNIFYGGGLDYPLTHNFIYTLREFDSYNYNNFLHYFNRLYNYNDTIFFNIDEETQQDFDKVKARLSELYQDIDIDNAYFVMFTFNNYLDVLHDGVYRCKTSDLEHEGVIVLLEDFYEGVFARVKWSYLQGELSFSLKFFNVNEFEIQLASDLSNPEILEDFRHITKITNAKGKLEFNMKHALKEKAYLEGKLEEVNQYINELDEELSNYGENDK